MHNRVLWVLQWLFGLYFIGVGIMHFIVPEGLPTPLAWMYDLSDTMHYVSGGAEILGGLGLIVPSVTRIPPILTPLAALGLAAIMLAAIFWHLGRDEFSNIAINVVNLVAMLYIAYGRTRLAPITAT